MTDFCTLHIRSETQSALPAVFLNQRDDLVVLFEDNESPERRASFERLARKGVLKRVGLPRYHWTISSDGFVEGADIHKHLSWIMDQVRPGFMLSQLAHWGYECSLQFYWEGNGTGGGPLITPQIAELLAHHNLDLQFGFYLKSTES